MDNKELTYKDIPMGYPLCFNEECTEKACCMHSQARKLMPENRYYGPSVFPTAWQDGACKCFREKRLVRKAWGFTHIYKNVPHHLRAEARRCVKNYFSSGCGPYYRYHHGENMLSLRQQADIMAILAKFGNTDDVAFDHYQTAWDFD